MAIYFTGANIFTNACKSSPLIIKKFTKVYSSNVNKQQFYATVQASFLVDVENSILKLNGFIRPESPKDDPSPGRVISVPIKCKVKQIVANSTHILLLDDHNQIWMYNFSRESSLKKIDLGLCSCPTEVCSCRPVIRKIHCGFGNEANPVYFAISSAGNLFTIPIRVFDDFPEKIVDVAHGKEHAIILTETGHVYSWGNGSRGQLGNGNLETELYPRLVEALAGIKIVKISAGGWHSFVLSVDHTVYSWGWNSHGQLGLGDTVSQVVTVPGIVNFDDNKINVKDVACGIHHSIALTDDLNLYGTGSNKYGQLTSAVADTEVNIMKLIDTSIFSVRDVSCGPYCTILFTNEV